MAIPKTLKVIEEKKATALIERHLKNGTGGWEDSPMRSDFVYGKMPNLTLIRPPTWSGGDWETGRVSL